MKTRFLFLALSFGLCLFTACDSQPDANKPAMTDSKPAATAAKYKLMTLDPGHFHAALVQKSMNDLVSPT
ncbi:MAG: hypothetical protein JNM09_26240, partial [Blastocatellia bacterium]|nr:hypothetical protein [Blastocatellia bacterium]